jgi:AcrR family transcriptional regulator
MMKKQPELTAQTRENLIEAFWSLYCQKKIEHITIKDITDKAGYNRSTFYEYFVDIYDVLNQLEDSLLEYLKGQVLNNLEGGLNEDNIQKVAEVYESKGNYLSVLLGENGDPYFTKKMKTIMRSTLMNHFGLLENDIHTSYIFEFGMSAIIATITHWYHQNKDLPSGEMVRLVRSLLMKGVVIEILKYTNLTFGVPFMSG